MVLFNFIKNILAMNYNSTCNENEHTFLLVKSLLSAVFFLIWWQCELIRYALFNEKKCVRSIHSPLEPPNDHAIDEQFFHNILRYNNVFQMRLFKVYFCPSSSYIGTCQHSKWKVRFTIEHIACFPIDTIFFVIKILIRVFKGWVSMCSLMQQYIKKYLYQYLKDCNFLFNRSIFISLKSITDIFNIWV